MIKKIGDTTKKTYLLQQILKKKHYFLGVYIYFEWFGSNQIKINAEINFKYPSTWYHHYVSPFRGRYIVFMLSVRRLSSFVTKVCALNSSFITHRNLTLFCMLAYYHSYIIVGPVIIWSFIFFNFCNDKVSPLFTLRNITILHFLK